MPRITLNGKGPQAPTGAAPTGRGRGAGKPAGPGQTFGDALANAIAQGQSLDPSLLQNAQFSPNYQTGAWRSAADRAILDRVTAAIQATRRGSSNAADSIARAQQGISLYRTAAGGNLSGQAASLNNILQRVIASAAGRSSGGALVPASTDVTKYLGRIDASTRQSAKVETDTWNRTRQVASGNAPPGWYVGAGGKWRPPGYTGPVPFGAPGGLNWGRGGPPIGGGLVPPGAGGGGAGGIPPIPPVPGGAAGGGGPGGPGGGNPNNPPGYVRRAGRGYGWGKALSRVPYVGGAISNIVEAGALGGPWAAAAATAVEGADALVFNRQMYGNAARGVQSNASLFAGVQGDAFAMARAGGYSGTEGLSQFYQGRVPPALMQAFGASPEDAMRQLSRFGIVQTDPGRQAAMFQALNVPQYSPAFSAMNQDQVQASAANAARYGVVDGRDASAVTRYFQQMGVTMEGATARGMDRASILRSIDASVAGSALRGAAGVSAAGQADFIGRFGNLPGGRTGELGLSNAATLDNAAGQVGTGAPQSMAYALATRRYGTQSSLEGLLGGKLNPAQQDTANLYFQAMRAGDTPAAASYLAALTQGNPNAISTVLTGPGSPASMMPGYRQPIAISGATGLGLNSSVQLGQHPGSRITSSSPLPPGSPLGATPDPKFDDSKIGDYAAGLTRMGVRPDLIPILIEEGKRAGINPLIAGATMMGESGGGHNAAAGRNVMQVTGSSGLVSNRNQVTSEQQSIRLGYQVESTMLNRFNGNVAQMHAGYEGPAWGTAANSGYENAIRNAYRAAGVGTDPNIPTQANAVNSYAGAAATNGSQASMEQGAALLPRFSAGLDSAGSALERFAARVNRLYNNPADRPVAPSGGAFAPLTPGIAPSGPGVNLN